MSRFAKALGLMVVLLMSSAGPAQAQAMQVPLETTTGWGPVEAPDGYKALRIQGRTTADPFVLARLFADFAAHPTMFPRVVDRVDVIACDSTSLMARYTTKFDPRPGPRTTVQSLSTVKAAVMDDRIEFTWGSDNVESAFVNAVRGRLLVATQRTSSGTETLVDYVSTVRPRNRAKGLLLESQKGVLVDDARYVIDRLMALATQRTPASGASSVFSCGTK